MRVGSDLKTKALLALEEVLHESRYGPVRRSRALAMALAYLWSEAGGDKRPFSDFWRLVGDQSEPHRFRYADRRLDEICKRLGTVRDLEASQAIWSEVHRGRAL